MQCPLYLLAGAADDITLPPQVFAAARLMRTPAALVRQVTVPGGHVGLFMGARTLHETWPDIGAWLSEPR